MISDGDGTLFRALTNGWVPWSVLVGPDGKVVFSENEFDESGFSTAIQQMYERPAAAQDSASARAVGAARLAPLSWVAAPAGWSLPASYGSGSRPTIASCSSTARPITSTSRRCCGRWSGSAA